MHLFLTKEKRLVFISASMHVFILIIYTCLCITDLRAGTLRDQKAASHPWCRSYSCELLPDVGAEN